MFSSNEDDLDDEDTNEESSLKSRNRDNSEVNSEVAEPSPGPSACSENQQLEDADLKDETGDDKAWPTITDLNTRLRRVITSYQRNYRKEEQKLQATKAKVSHLSLRFDYVLLHSMLAQNLVQAILCLPQYVPFLLSLHTCSL